MSHSRSDRSRWTTEERILRRAQRLGRHYRRTRLQELALEGHIELDDLIDYVDHQIVRMDDVLKELAAEGLFK